MPSPASLDLFVVTAPGLAPLTARELRALGIEPRRVEPDGVSFDGSLADLYRANLHLRTASRIVVRLGAFRVRSFHELERLARKLPWRDYLAPGSPVRARVTARKSRLYHSDAVAERIERWAAEAVGGGSNAPQPRRPRRASEEPDDTHDAAEQLVTVRLLHDECVVSVDSSGALLHMRGYRQALAKAPMRETLAAAMLLASGWSEHPAAPLLDPLCGSGTIPIEAALLARRIAPGIARDFAFMRWPGFDRALWTRLTAEARAAELPAAPGAILGSDRDAGAIEAALANAARAGVAGDIAFSQRAISAIEPPPPAADGAGWVVANPPYGVRVGDEDRLRNLYASLGHVLRAQCPGWHLALLSARRELERHLGIPLETLARTTNGGIPVRIQLGHMLEPVSMG